MKIVSQSILGLIAVVALGACNGQNPVNRQSDPLVGDNNLNGDVGTPPKPTPPPKALPTSNCANKYQLNITDSTGKDVGRALVFEVGTESVYTLHFSPAGSVTVVSLSGGPNDMSKPKQTSGTDWTLDWKPSSTDGNFAGNLSIFATVPGQNNCLSAIFPEPISVIVNESNNQPTVRVSGLDNLTPHQPTDKIQFTVDVTDPSLQGAASTTEVPQFLSYSQNSSGQTFWLSADGVAECGKGSTSGQTVHFACTYDLGKLISLNAGKNLAISWLQTTYTDKQGLTSVSIDKQILVNMPLPTTSNPPPKSGAKP